MRRQRGGTGHGEVDWELLADHLGGALAGTADGARVAKLIASDAAWVQAAAELSGALDAVTGALRSLPAPVMPDDVVARLDSVLRQAGITAHPAPAGDPVPASTTPASPDPVHRTPAPTPAGLAASPRELARAGRVPLDQLPAPRPGGTPAAGRPASERRHPAAPPTRPGRRRQRRLARWGAGLAAAAGVMAFATVGLLNWQERPASIAERADSPAFAPDSLSGQPPQESASGSEPLLNASGIDYQRQAFADDERATGGPSISGSGGQPGAVDPPAAPGTTGTGTPPPAVPAELGRLWSDPQARADCLTAVVAAFAPATATVQTIDFARFDGQPALVMWVMSSGGTSWVWVSGPACGLPAAGPDLQFRAELP